MPDTSYDILCSVCGAKLGESDIEGQTLVCSSHSAIEVNPPTWDDIRHQRDGLLSNCDWTQMSDSPLSAESKSAWATYRQALRDIPETYSTPTLVVWPTVPK